MPVIEKYPHWKNAGPWYRQLAVRVWMRWHSRGGRTGIYIIAERR
jgi:hypothetical protein